MRVCFISSRASLRSSGGRAWAVSLMTSTAVPPAPNMRIGPNVASSAMPMISSWRARLAHHGLHREALDARLRLGAPDLVQHLARRRLDLGRALQLQAHAADVGLVRDVLRKDLQDAGLVGLEQARRFLAGRVRIRRHGGGHDRNAVGGQQGFGIDLGQDEVASRPGAGDDRARGRAFGVIPSASAGGARISSSCARVCRTSCMKPSTAAVGVSKEASPAALSCRRAAPAAPSPIQLVSTGLRVPCAASYHFLDGARDGVACAESCRAIENENGVRAAIREQRAEGCRVPIRSRVSDDVDRVGARPGGRQDGIQRTQQVRAQLGHAPVQAGQPVGREHAGSAPIGQDHQALALEPRHARDHLGRLK